MFPSTRGNLLDRAVVFKIINQKAKEIGLNDVTPHELRHFNVSQALEAGVPIQQVSSLACHYNINTTLLYSHTSRELLRKLNEM
jgi:site-specific recombinase XerD